ncbi:hypothetical protein E5F05_10170 [Deinococcus metallilatus]|uniref:Uncharacterized protein n=1 Tax=Deinococcus metallilatus TaxID=1211322 RepID=A0AAJ5F3Z6_9DEIO|nr:hypothetical protein [Deinococcus metallilatus]MBB5295890.1 hypothetical protein [Deinococcus metallilatus]QBY08275.1 hypothetical protein E5F05_10170 [Deinococcus metallilatus]RXJ12006.1 hypothetical protein ERJ73_08980 [Deinococcus metallilatus]TLK25762.1 hypothetical protein FCS05_12000 [Deinococcus metallilatus]GMA14576.1 hypothetical protein GCM10025871_09070 [Deinococcus metallilatus]
MRRALLTLTALLTLSGPAQANHQQGNLRALTAADLCPPLAYVYVDDQEQEDLAVAADEQLARSATLYDIPFGDPKTCTVAQIYTLDAFQTRDGRFLYSLELSLELVKDAQVRLGSRTLTASHLQLWSTSGYGSVPDAEALAALAAERVRPYYEEFALAWKATHPK